jgi:integrase
VVWSLARVRASVAAAVDNYHYPLYVLALSTGMRQGELPGLQIEDIDFVQRALSAKQSLELVHGTGELRLSPPKSERGRRMIQIPSPAVTVLRAHVARSKRSAGFVFLSHPADLERFCLFCRAC